MTAPGNRTRQDLLDWLVLRRAADGGIARVGQCWLCGGRRLPSSLTGPIDELIEAGLLALADPDPVPATRTAVVLTDAGRIRYAALSQRQQVTR